MTILQQPDALSLSQNLNEFRIISDIQVSFILKQGVIEILSQRYDPSTDGCITINLRDIIHSRLSCQLLDSGDTYQQQTLVSDFIAIINGTTNITFRVIRAGADKLADSPTNFLTQNFLTWQPSIKPVTYYSPEFLTYYAVVACKAKLTAYFTNESGTVISQTNHTIVSLLPNTAYTIPLQYSVVAGWLNHRLPAYYDVWIENQSGQRLTYIQRYYAEDLRSEQEQWILFENSLGGIDTFRAYGTTTFNGDHAHNLAEIGEIFQEYRVDTERTFQKNTGHLNGDERKWLLDFFPSQAKYLYIGNYLRPIVLTESNVSYEQLDMPSNYTFTFKFADARPLLNLPRTDAPADVLNISVPSVGSFTVPPRLAEFSRLPLSEGALFPVQNPYSEEWGTTTAQAITSFIEQALSSTAGKGYFSTETRFLAKFPSGKTGEYAFVGTPWPGTVYEWIDTKWVDTKVAPQLGESIFVALLKRHIDNNTIYWEEANKVIKSKGGGDDTTFTITASMDETQGVRGEILPAAENKVPKGGSLTLTITPKRGFEVQRVNVDKVGQGAITEYTFDDVQADHTMYVWFEPAAIVNPTDFLERSDLPGTYYSSLQSAFDAVKEAYPAGLTKDVTITCVKKAQEKRTGKVFLARLEYFNKDTTYVLTLDGAGLLTLDGDSFGGIEVSSSDNLLIRKVAFINCGNNAEYYSPEELSAVYCWGTAQQYVRNIYIEDCTIDGLNVNRNIKAWYSFVAKCVDNVFISGCRFENNNVVSLKFTDCKLTTLSRTYVKADHSDGIFGHPALCAYTNGHELIAEDCEFTGDSSEYYFSVANVGKVSFSRSTFKGGRGRVIELSAKTSVKEFSLESCLFVDMLGAPCYGWLHEYISFACRIDVLNIIDNTISLTSPHWQQHFIRAYSSSIGVANIYNNIFCATPCPTGKAKRGICLGNVETINSGNNVHQFKLRSGEQTSEAFFAANGKSYIALSQMKAEKLEVNSSIIGDENKLLDSEYKILASEVASYPPNVSRLPMADLGYKAPAANGNTVGCYNLGGVAIDETNDSTTGYAGEDIVEETIFDNDGQYSTYADNVIVLKHKTKNRKMFVKMKIIGPQHEYLVLGKYGVLHPLPVINEYGEYAEDEVYTINVE